MAEKITPEQPQISRGAYLRAINRVSRYLDETPNIPALPGLIGFYNETLNDLTQSSITINPGSLAFKALRYTLLKKVEDHHQQYSLTDDYTQNVRFRFLNEAAFSDSRPYNGLRSAIMDGHREAWRYLTYSREWSRVQRCLTLNDELIPLDPSTKQTPRPVRADGLSVGADSSLEASAWSLGATLASYYSQEEYPELDNNLEQMGRIAMDLADVSITRGYRHFVGQQALSFINFGMLRLGQRREKWIYRHDGTLSNSYADGFQRKIPHIGCIVGIQPRDEVVDDEYLEGADHAVTDLHRVAWAGVNAGLQARKPYEWYSGLTTWLMHPRRLLSDFTLQKYLTEQQNYGSPSVLDGPSELLNYHLECIEWI